MCTLDLEGDDMESGKLYSCAAALAAKKWYVGSATGAKAAAPLAAVHEHQHRRTRKGDAGAWAEVDDVLKEVRGPSTSHGAIWK